MISLSTISDLRLYGGADDLAFVRGFAGEFDGGEGFFARRDNWPGQDNSGTVVVDSSMRRWVRQYDDAIDVAWFGVRESVQDNRPALQTAIDASWTEGHRKLVCGAGLFRFAGAVDASGVTLDGVGPLWGTHFIQTQTGADMFVGAGVKSDIKASGPRIRDLWIDAAPGVAAGYAVRLYGDAINQPDEFDLSRLRISGQDTATGGTWYGAINLNSTQRQSPSGCRGGGLRSIKTFNCRGPAVVLWGFVVGECFGVECFAGLGVTSLSGIWIGGTAAVPSWGTKIEASHTEGPFNCANSQQISGFGNRFGGGRQIDMPSTSYINVDNVLGT